jgi:hypothetical protein
MDPLIAATEESITLYEGYKEDGEECVDFMNDA